MNDDSPYDIQIHNPHSCDVVDETLLRDAVSRVLQRFKLRRAEISLAVVDDRTIAELHGRYLDTPGSTDVLTFNLADAPEPGCIEGEIVISVDTARRCAAQRGHSATAELALYAVHGALHLVGLDDADEAQAGRMHQLEDDILTAAGVGPIYRDVQS